MKWYKRLTGNGLLVLIIIIVLAGMPVGVRAQETSGLVAYYPFNGNSNDISGNDNHGIVYGANLTMDRFEGAKSAYRFDGVDDYIDIGNNASLKMTDGLTISVWINISSYAPKYQNIISDHAPNEVTAGPGKILRFNYNTLQFIVGGIYGYGTATYVKYTFDNNMLGKWQHVVSTYDRNIVRLYVNGVEVDSRQYTAPLTVNSNHILMGKSGYGEYLNGIVDDVRIYNRALSPEEIKSPTITSPNGGENWTRGTTQTIRWTYSGTPGSYVKIELLKGGVLTRTINSNTSIGSSGSGSYTWLINSTQALGTDYKVRVTSTANSAYNDTSNTNFTISALIPKTGDINGDGQLTLVDAIYLAKHVGGFSGYETIYADGDINCDGKVTLVDAIYLAKHVGGFSGYEKLY